MAEDIRARNNQNTTEDQEKDIEYEVSGPQNQPGANNGDSRDETGTKAAEGTEAAVDEALRYKTQADEYLQLLQRLQADFDNFRKRTVQEREESAKYCSLRLAASLLPVLDNFERALSAPGDDLNKFMAGIELIYKQLRDALEKEGVKALEAVGTEFDPNFHEAVMHEPSDKYPDNTVIEELQKGYMIIDRVIRPTMVKVAKS